LAERPASSLGRNLALAVASVLVLLLVLELGVRSVDVLKGRGFFWDNRNLLAKRRPLVPFRMFGFDPQRDVDGVRFIASRHGELFRLEKPAGTCRIVCFGGSTTENLVDGLHYPLQLQTLLRQRLGRDDIEVINLGNSAYATPHSIILLELNVIHWQPDLLILSHNINDLTAAYFPGFRSDYANKYTNEFFLPDHEERVTPLNVLFQHSQLYWFLLGRWNGMKMAAYPREPLQRRSQGNQPPPEAQAVFEENLRTFATLARAHGIPVLFASQARTPSEEFFLLHYAYKPASYKHAIVFPLHEELLAQHQSFNRSLEKVAGETDAWFLDNAQRVGEDEVYFADMVHYTKAGLMRLAQSYADFLIDDGVLESVCGR